MENMSGSAYPWLPMMRLFMLTLLCACGPSVYDYSKEPDPRKSEFVIGISDALRITVWKNPELSSEVRVRPDGTITLPLIGDVRAAGRTPTALRNEITNRLKAFIKDETAAVSIAVIEVNSYRFTVAGNAEKPGVYSSKYFVTVSEAVAMAGGLNRYATPSKMVIVRGEESDLRRIPIDYNRISSGEHPNENLVVLSGDSLYIP
jgi:polysaccharide export outer membrane protein